MKVLELIRELKVQDPDAEVRMVDDSPVYVQPSEDRTVYITDAPPDEPDATDPETLTIIARLLSYSFGDVDFKWDGLTLREQRIIRTREAHKRVLAFVRQHDRG